MLYIQPGLIALWPVNPNLLIQIEQMRQVTSSPQRQPVSNPTNRDRGFGSQRAANLTLSGWPLRRATICSVVLVQRDLFLVVAAIHHVVNRPRGLDAQLASHIPWVEISNPQAQCQPGNITLSLTGRRRRSR
jgi:hypothetical protein